MNDTFVELAVAILATAIENDEIFNVDKKIVEDIVTSMKLSKPGLKLKYTKTATD